MCENAFVFSLTLNPKSIVYTMIFGLVEPKSVVAFIRRWLYAFTIGAWAFGLLPISTVTYLAFYRTLIPNEVIKVPLEFQYHDTALSHEGFEHVTMIDFSKLIPIVSKEPSFNYLVNLNIEVYCNKNRIDDIFPIAHELTIGNSSVTLRSQFVLNCDSRFLYHNKNGIIPYNLRFWTPPIITDIAKSVEINSPYTVINAKDLVTAITSDNSHQGKLKWDQDLVVNFQTSFLEFKIMWHGFRFYLTYYYKASLVVGVLFLWSLSSFICLVTGVFMFTSDIKQEQQNKDKLGAKYNNNNTNTSSNSDSGNEDNNNYNNDDTHGSNDDHDDNKHNDIKPDPEIKQES